MPPVSGLVLTRDESVSDETLRATLATIAGLELGDSVSRRIPATLCTDDAPSHQDALASLEQTVGVRFVDLAFHDFEDVVIAPESLLRRKRRGDQHGTP